MKVKGEYLKETLKLANEGDAEAQFKYASTLSVSRFLTKKKKETMFKYYMMSAEQGYYRAEYEVGRCYIMGVGVSFNEVSAQYWFNKAIDKIKEEAEKNDCTAQYLYAYSFENGLGVETNLGLARIWYKKAVDNGYKYAQDKLKKIDSGEISNKDDVLVKAQNGDSLSQFLYAKSLVSKKNVTKKDKEQAVIWFSKSAEQGNSEALYELGLCYLFGDGVEENSDKAIHFLEKAERLGNKDANKLLEKING